MGPIKTKIALRRSATSHSSWYRSRHLWSKSLWNTSGSHARRRPYLHASTRQHQTNG